MSALFSVNGPFDLLNAVPLAFRFIPEDATVILCFDSGRLVLGSRIDLSISAEEVDAQAGVITEAVTRNGGCDAVVLVNYCTRLMDSIGLMDTIGLCLTAAEVNVMATITVQGSQIDGTAVFTCADDPTVYPAPTVADLLPGFPLMALDRDTNARSVEPGPRADAVSARVAAFRDSGAACDAESLDRALWASASTLSDDAVARAVHAMSDVGMLDAVLIGWTAASGQDPDTAPTVEGMRARLTQDATRVERLVELSACLTDTEAAPVLSCLVVAAFASGNGALANIALARLSRTNADRHPFVIVVDGLLSRGLDPARYLP